MRISGGMADLSRYTQQAHQAKQQLRQPIVNEAFTGQVHTQIQGTGKFSRTYGGSGTLQHIDMII